MANAKSAFCAFHVARLTRPSRDRFRNRLRVFAASSRHLSAGSRSPAARGTFDQLRQPLVAFGVPITPPLSTLVPRCAGWAVSVGSEVVFVVDSLEGAVDLLVKFIHDPLALPLLLVVGISGQVALEVVHVAVQSVKPNPLP